MQLYGHNQIGFSQSKLGTKTFHTFNCAANVQNDCIHHEATFEEIQNAIHLAHLCAPTYANTTSEVRAQFLNTIADEIMALGQELLDIYIMESSLPQTRAEGERGRTIGQLRAFANYLLENNYKDVIVDKALPERSPLPRPEIRKENIAIGPVAVFGSSNFPFAYSTAGGDTASALAAGCPVIIKSHPMHAGTSEAVANAITQAAIKCNIPNGVFSNLNSSDHTVGTILVKHPSIKAVGFTGSITGGRSLMDIASTRVHPIPVFAEMGSLNPLILLKEELQHNTSKWAKTIASSITQGCGQFCTKPGLILMEKNAVSTTFLSELASEVKALPSMPMLHPSIYEKFAKSVATVQNIEGINQILNHKEIGESYKANHFLFGATAREFIKNPILHEEVFGPYALIILCENQTEIQKALESLDGQLTATIVASKQEMAESIDIIHTMMQKAGRLIYNGVPTGVEVCTSMVHGGPYPASSDSRFTAVGINAIYRWLRPICFQNWNE